MTDTDSFDITFNDPCLDSNFVTFTEPTQTDPADDNFSGNDVTFTYDPITVEPSFCTLTVTCEDVTFANTNGKNYAVQSPLIACLPIDSND